MSDMINSGAAVCAAMVRCLERLNQAVAGFHDSDAVAGSVLADVELELRRMGEALVMAEMGLLPELPEPELPAPPSSADNNA